MALVLFDIHPNHSKQLPSASSFRGQVTNRKHIIKKLFFESDILNLASQIIFSPITSFYIKQTKKAKTPPQKNMLTFPSSGDMFGNRLRTQVIRPPML